MVIISNEFKILFLYKFKLDHCVTELYRNIKLTFGENSINKRIVR